MAALSASDLLEETRSMWRRWRRGSRRSVASTSGSHLLLPHGQVVLLSVTAMVGAGVLGLPFAMSQLAWSAGTVAIGGSLGITLYTLWQMVDG
jgi:hypothetical protein